MGAVGHPPQLGAGDEALHRHPHPLRRREGVGVAGEDQRWNGDPWQEVRGAVGLGGEGHRRDRRRVELAEVVDVEVDVLGGRVRPDHPDELP